MITEDYCSFEIAKLLKEKGFEGDTNAYYHIWDYGNKVCSVQEFSHSEAPHLYIPAPTLQMAMKWLREVYNVVIVIDVCRETGREGFYCWQLENNRTGDWIGNIVGECPTYEQACEAALKYYLENLI
jgi:hypothetical protein